MNIFKVYSSEFLSLLQRSFRWIMDLSLRNKILLGLGSLVGVLLVFGVARGNGPDSETVVVKRGNLDRTVLASGKVVSATDLSLSFQKSGFVKKVNVIVGQKVRAGEVLASLEANEQLAELSKARGGLLLAQARYRKVEEGLSGEEVKLAEVKLANAKRVQDALVASARRRLLSDDLEAVAANKNTTSGTPTITGTYNAETSGEYRIEFDRGNSEIKYSGLENGRMTVSESAVPLGVRGLLIAFPDEGYGIGSEWIIEVPNKNGDSYASNLNAYEEALQTRQQAISEAEAELEIKKARGRSVDLDAARADVLVAEGVVAAAYAEYEKALIKAPADGTITKVDISPGEMAETLSEAIVLQDIQNLYLEADINESSIKNISIGQDVAVTYDAFGRDETFTANVTSVDWGATVVDGIVNYKIKALIPDPGNIRPGMTANLSIKTASVIDVLFLPSRFIYKEDGREFVWLLGGRNGSSKDKRFITAGIEGDGAAIEIRSGLEEGDTITLNSGK